MRQKIKTAFFIFFLQLCGVAAYAQNTPLPQILQKLSAPQTSNRAELLRDLKKYKTSDYGTEERKQLLRVLAADSLSGYETVLRVAGQVGVGTEKLSALSDNTDNPGLQATAKLALARIGDQSMLDNLMRNVKKKAVDDVFVYHIAPSLIYVRQKPATDYLFDLILSNEKGCTSPNPDSDTKMPCAYRLIEMLAPVVIEFPVQLSQSGDIKTDSYEKTLSEVRQWISINRNDYQLNRDSY